MAATLYPKFLEELLKNGLALTSLDVRAIFVDSADETYNAADEFLSDITGAGLIGTATALTSKTFTGGVFDAADTTLTAVTGDPFEVVLLYIHTGTSSTSRLIAFLDGLSFTPNGSGIQIVWPGGASKIFAL